MVRTVSKRGRASNRVNVSKIGDAAYIFLIAMVSCSCSVLKTASSKLTAGMCNCSGTPTADAYVKALGLKTEAKPNPFSLS